ncbi:PIN domain-containing protein [Serratia bockelmannii]|uniref:PIN domain-containing protein n=1 Tax=Serratia bockelmannii TaxID=2703793 RepID=UPI00301D65B8
MENKNPDKKQNKMELDNVFSLERRFPVVENIFTIYKDVNASDRDTIIFLDTNVLLLPYVAKQLGKQDIKEIQNLYVKLKSEGRLFISDRVAREFIKNRDNKISDIVKALSDDNSRIKQLESLSKIFQETSQFEELENLSTKINELIVNYKKNHNKMVDEVKSWKGKDPITTIYDKVFDSKNVISISDSEEELLTEWEYRKKIKIPPGYKDSEKDDTGVGDFLIWKSILQLGKEQQKDIIFITGEKKSDWFTLSNNEPISVRSELNDEFRRITGKSIGLTNLAGLLSVYKFSTEIVDKVENAESIFNNHYITKNVTNRLSKHLEETYYKLSGINSFDYSTHNGMIEISNEGIAFNVKFSKAGDTSIYVYNDGGSYQLARVKNSNRGDVLEFDNYDSSSRVYNIRKGEVVLFRNMQGDVLAIRILNIKDDSRNDDQDLVQYIYTIYPNGDEIISP